MITDLTRTITETDALLADLNSQGVRLRLDGSVLNASPRSKVTAAIKRIIRDNKAALVDYLSSSAPANDPPHHSYDPAFLGRLQTELGDDWDEISSDPAQLEAAAELLRTDECRRAGRIPPHYTATTICQGCGPVPIFEGTAGHVLGCPWCYNRTKGLPIPRPLLPT